MTTTDLLERARSASSLEEECDDALLRLLKEEHELNQSIGEAERAIRMHRRRLNAIAEERAVWTKRREVSNAD
jgi:ActR/RegA family two-component response regulator